MQIEENLLLNDLFTPTEIYRDMEIDEKDRVREGE
jgi:hypothetical protein